MLLLLAKKKPSSLILPLFTAHRRTTFDSTLTTHLPRRLWFSDSAIQNPDHPKLHFMLDFLIATCGFSPDKASIISKPLACLKSPKNPKSVLHFLKFQGFSEAEIKTLITGYPHLLNSSPENTLDPNLRALRDIGLSTSALTQLLLSGPCALQLRLAVPRIKFWLDFFGHDEAALVKAFKQNRGIVAHDTTPIITRKIPLLRRHGLSSPDIRRLILTAPRFVTSSVRSIENLLKRARELGFQPESGMFVLGLHAVACASGELLKKKMELLKSLGWSETEFLSALLKAPGMVMLSEKNLRMKMDFLVEQVRCDPSYIASFPVLLSYSMEKRLRPRYQVLHLLNSKGLSCKRQGFYSAIVLSDRKFVEIYILPHKEEISDLREAYLAACASGP